MGVYHGASTRHTSLSREACHLRLSDNSLIDVANHFEKVEAKISMLSAAVGNRRRTCEHKTGAVNTQSDTHVYVGPSRP